MTRGLLQGELKKLAKCRPVWVLMLFFVGFSLLVGHVLFGNQKQAVAESPTMAEFVGIPVDPVERGENNFWMMVKESSILSLLPTALAAALLGLEFKRRGVSQAMVGGYSRRKVFFVKAVEYYVLSFLILAVCPVYSMALYCAPWLRTLDSTGMAKVALTLFLRFLIELGYISLFLPLAFFFRDVLKTTVASAGLAFLAALVPMPRLGRDLPRYRISSRWPIISACSLRQGHR